MTKLLRAVNQARRRRDVTTARFHELIRQANEEHTIREVANAAGLSPSRVWQIIREEGRDGS